MGLDHRPLHDKINVKCTVNVETWTSETILQMCSTLSLVEEESRIYIEEVNFEKPWTYFRNLLRYKENELQKRPKSGCPPGTGSKVNPHTMYFVAIVHKLVEYSLCWLTGYIGYNSLVKYSHSCISTNVL